jgi:hypothetical protein
MGLFPSIGRPSELGPAMMRLQKHGSSAVECECSILGGMLREKERSILSCECANVEAKALCSVERSTSELMNFAASPALESESRSVFKCATRS